MTKQDFNNWIHKFCILTGLGLLILMIGYPILVSIIYGVWPNWTQVIPGIISLVLLLAPWWPGECLGYMTTMGPGALYLSYITGNVTNLRMPATVGTMNALGLEPNTDECHTMAIIACGASNFTTIGLLLIGIILAAPLTPILKSEAIQPAFNMALPALFGGLVAQSVFTKGKKEWGLWLVPLAVGLIFTYILPIPGAYNMLIIVLVAALTWYLGIYKTSQKVK